MSTIARGIIAIPIFLAGTCFSPASYAGYINSDHRESFLSSDLQNQFYSIEVATVRFLDRQRSGVNGLVESFRGTSVYAYDLFTRAFCYGKGGALDCQAFTYDNALAVMAYLLAGEEKKAADLLKVYRREFYNPKNDVPGLNNCYRSDRRPEQGLAAGSDGDRMHLGPSMWMGMAALQYIAMTGDTEFLAFAVDLGRWSENLKHCYFEDGDPGGVSMGYGWGPPDWSKVYSTENNIDYYAFLSMMMTIFEQGDEGVHNVFLNKGYGPENMDREREGVARWIKEVAYDREKGYLLCGYNERGRDILKALDTISWSIASFGPEKLKEMGVDPFRLMDLAERDFLVRNNVLGEEVGGFDFTDRVGRAGPIRLVWIEGTGQQIIAYQVMSRYTQKLGFDELAERYRNKSQWLSDQLQRVAELVSLDGALPYTSRCPKEREIIYVFNQGWEIPRGNNGQWVGSVSATVWRYFALAGFNPMVFDEKAVDYRLFQGGSSNQ